MSADSQRPWGVYDMGSVVAVALRREADMHDLRSESCRCRPTVSREFARVLVMHAALTFAGVKVPDAWPSEGALA